MPITSYPYKHLMEYLPQRYSATPAQDRDRKTVYSFKNGKYSDYVKDKMCEYINELTSKDKCNWVVAFIPASTSIKTSQRYSELAKYIQQTTGVETSLEGIINKLDVASKHISGQVNNPREVFTFNKSTFCDKKVILIDDVITSGHSFERSANVIKSLGAVSIHGLFVAKTINPDWHIRSCRYSSDWDSDPEDCDDDLFSDENDEFSQEDSIDVSAMDEFIEECAPDDIVDDFDDEDYIDAMDPRYHIF